MDSSIEVDVGQLLRWRGQCCTQLAECIPTQLIFVIPSAYLIGKRNLASGATNLYLIEIMILCPQLVCDPAINERGDALRLYLRAWWWQWKRACTTLVMRSFVGWVTPQEWRPRRRD